MLDFLKAAAAVGQNSDSEMLRGDVLGFLLVYATPPDVDAEKTRIADLLEGDGFSLFRMSEEDPALLVLTFNGIGNDQAPDFLFQLAEELRSRLALVAAEPETGPQYTDLNTSRAQTESLGGLVDAICRSGAGAHSDPDWALKLMKVDRAMAAHAVTGAGIRVGQPDTGVAAHDELAGALNTSRGANFVEGGGDPTDPLRASMASPGHGTGAASVMISRASLRINGTAPGAELVPIRVVDGVVFGLGLAVARGIDHARAQGCHVVSISLGTVTPGLALRRAVARAVAADMIVVAAAGNCVGFVVYPGWDRNVITVAGITRNKKRWVGSCRGDAVDVSAPAENVHKALRTAGAVGAGTLRAVDPLAQGTTFATAMTAGVAALWLQRFGVQRLRQVARARGMPLQELFRAALRQSADAPAGWDKARMGSGIVDAQALLDLAPDRIGVMPQLESGGPALAVFGDDFEGTGLEVEAGFIASDRLMRQAGVSHVLSESGGFMRPSPRLQALIAAVDRTEARIPLAAPVVLGGVAPPIGSLQASLRRLSATQTSGLESAAAVDDGAALSRLRRNGAAALLEQAEAGFTSRTGTADAAVQASALKRMRPVVDALTSGDDLDSLPAAETHAVLEALVRLTGRPAIRLHADGSEIDDPLLGMWRDHIVPTRATWREKTDAVGRIDVQVNPGEWTPVGTGILIGDGRVLTNRHVIDLFAVLMPTRDGVPRFALRWPVSIIFDPAAQDEATRFALPSVMSAGRHKVGRRMDLSKLDVAVMAMTMENGGGDAPFPMPAGTSGTTAADLTRLMVSGYPLEPQNRMAGPSALDDPALHDRFWDRIEELFGDRYGVQYISPGMMVQRAGSVEFDPNGWAFTHDATTLGGSSGSVVLSLHANMPLCGLHFGGESLAANYAHDIEMIRTKGDGVFETRFLPV